MKPANLLIGDDGRVQIADLGLARSLIADDPDSVPGGTRIYMAPERLAGAPASAAADQFSLCVALWEALFGVRPWVSNSMEIAGVVPPARARLWPAIPVQLERVLRRGLAVGFERDGDE